MHIRAAMYRKLIGACVGLAMMGVAGTASAGLIYSYDFNNLLSDTLGAGPDMTNNGGTLGATGLTFGANQGPTLAAGVLPSSSVYAIEMQVTLDSTNGFAKLIDFDNLTMDSGLYNASSTTFNFTFCNTLDCANGLVVFTIGDSTNVLFSRDGANQIAGYLDGIQSFSVSDAAGLALVDTVLNFMRDDSITNGGESTSGFLDYIRFYDTAVTPDDLEVPLATPEPSTLALFATGLALLAFMGWRRRGSVQVKAA